MTFLILQMIPNFAALIAIYILATLTKLIDTHLGLILVYVGGQIPMNTWLMKGYLDTIPKELDESAKIDGAGHLHFFPNCHAAGYTYYCGSAYYRSLHHLLISLSRVFY